MTEPERVHEDLLLRLPQVRRPLQTLAAAVLLLATVAVLCDLYGLTALVGAPLTWDYTIGPLVGFLVLSVTWLGIAAVNVRLFAPLLRSSR